MKGLTTCLWFDNQAEEAARFYTSLFKHSHVGDLTHYGAAGSKASGRPEGSVMTVEFELAGDRYLALNGGPDFKFTEATSIVVNCEDQAEVDHYWSKLSEGGAEGPCGWLKDRYGLSWQITPTVLTEMLKDSDSVRSERVMSAMLAMNKIGIAVLKDAYDAVPVGVGE